MPADWLRLPDGAAAGGAYMLADDEVWIFRRGGGLAGLSNICPHKLGPLNEGRELSAARVQCPWHGWEFDRETGRCLNHASPPLRRYEVKEEAGGLYVRRIA